MFKQLSARRRKKGAPAAKEGRKGRVTVSVHPLFFALGAYFLLTGRFFVFLSVTAAALLHESGHAFYAARIGCRLNRLRLLPCGAVAEGGIVMLVTHQEVPVEKARLMVIEPENWSPKKRSAVEKALDDAAALEAENAQN